MKRSKVFSLFLLIIFFGVCQNAPIQAQKAQNSKAKKQRVVWIPATIKNITVGKSKYKDLIKHWGKPEFEQQFDEDGEDAEVRKLEPKTELAYRNIEINGLKPNIGVVIGDKTRIVLSISLFFDEVSKEEAIRIFGSDYNLISNNEDPCTTGPQKKRGGTKLVYPIELVYPRKGMLILIRDDNTVMSVSYTSKCS